MDRLSKWMNLLGMKYKHKIYVLSWIGNFARLKPSHDGDNSSLSFIECATEMVRILEMDKDPHDNILDLIDYINALKYIDIARDGLDYKEDVSRWKRQLLEE